MIERPACLCCAADRARRVVTLAAPALARAQDGPSIRAVRADPVAVGEGEVVAFEADAVHPDAAPMRYGCDFGDGTVLASEDDRRVASHTYDEPGAFRVTVTVDDGDGGTATRTETVIVGTGLDYAATGAVEIPEGTSVVPSLTAVPVRQDGDAIAFDGDLAAAIASARGAGARRCGSRRAARRSRRRPSWSRGRPRASPGRCGPAMSAAAGGPNASGSGSCGRGSRTSRLRSRGPRS